jgi:integrase
VNLTDLSIRSLKSPERGQKTYHDDTLPGFGVRVSQGGTKSFVLMYGRQRQMTTIGRYPIISLSEARGAAMRILAERTLGKHQIRSATVAEAATAYLAAVKKRNKPRTHKDYEYHLGRHLLPAFRHDDLADLGKTRVLERLEKLSATPAEQNYAFAVFRAFFRWAVRNNYLDRSPLEGMRLPNRNRTGERVLSPEELRRVWQVADGTFGKIVRLLILTGQRRGEISALRLSYLNRIEKLVTLPSPLTKNKREHVFPYGNMAGEVIRSIPDNYDYVFPAASVRSEHT